VAAARRIRPPKRGKKPNKKTPVAATMLQNFKLGGKPNRTKPNRTESSGTKRSGSDKPHTKSSQQNVDSLTNRRPTGNGGGDSLLLNNLICIHLPNMSGAHQFAAKTGVDSLISQAFLSRNSFADSHGQFKTFSLNLNFKVLSFSLKSNLLTL